ncbi:hypothetical protein WMF01_12290 [Sorangium sp. So ce1667]
MSCHTSAAHLMNQLDNLRRALATLSGCVDTFAEVDKDRRVYGARGRMEESVDLFRVLFLRLRGDVLMLALARPGALNLDSVVAALDEVDECLVEIDDCTGMIRFRPRQRRARLMAAMSGIASMLGVLSDRIGEARFVAPVASVEPVRRAA